MSFVGTLYLGKHIEQKDMTKDKTSGKHYYLKENQSSKKTERWDLKW